MVSRTRRKEEEQPRIQLDMIVPKRRESEFLPPAENEGSITKEQVKRQLLEGMKTIGYVYPKNKEALAATLANEIMALGSDSAINKKIGEVRSALIEIAEHTYDFADGAFHMLNKHSCASLFVLHTAEFAKIAKTAGISAGDALYSFEDERFANLFRNHPEEIARIAEEAGRYGMDGAFAAIAKPEIADAFEKAHKAVASAICTISRSEGE